MGIYLGSQYIDNIELIQYQNINTDIEDGLINKTIISYHNSEISNIRNYAFAYCYSLTLIDLPQVTSIGSSAFLSCSSLASVNLPQVITIESYAFAYCYSLTSINLPQTTSIGNNAFRTCSSLTSVNLPRVTSIGSYAFYTCSSLTSVNLPQVTTIGNNAFYQCSYLTSVNLPQAITIGNAAFYSCKFLPSINLPQITTIGSSAFQYCYSLFSINLPQVTTIGSDAFYYCTSLASINLPQATTIGSEAFFHCYNLLSIYLLGSSIPSLANINAFRSTPISNYTTSTGGVYGSIYVPASLYNSYITATNWSVYSSRIVSTNIVYNGSYEVYHESYAASNINNVSIPNVTIIPPDVLYIEINGIKYECPKQDVSSDYEYPAYAYGYYGFISEWSSDDCPFCLVFSNDNETLTILSFVAEAGDYISLTVFYT